MNIFDVHIKNGEVIDGTGAPKFKSDIIIDKGKIIGVFPAENGDVRDPSENHFLSNFKAKHTINAENKICPKEDILIQNNSYYLYKWIKELNINSS